MVDILFFVLAFYIACWIRVTCHELAHFVGAIIIGVRPFAIGLGKPKWKIKLNHWLELHLGLNPFAGYVAFIKNDVSDKQEAFMTIAGPIGDCIAIPVMFLVAAHFLPFWAFSGVYCVCVASLVSVIEGRFNKGHDLYEFARLTSNK